MHKGLDGLFRGVGDLLQIASELAQRTEGDAVYGVSVRVGSGPVVSRVRHAPGAAQRHSDARATRADVFDEDDHYLVVAELPGVAESAVQWMIRDDVRVVIRATSQDRTYARDIPLASRVDSRTAVARFGNGVLELRVWKQQPR